MKSALLTVAAVALACAAAPAAYCQEVTSACYFPDRPFPQYINLWQEGWSFKGEDGLKLVYARPDMPLGGYVFVHYKNTGKAPLKVTDLTVQGVKMSEALAKNWIPERLDQRYDTSLLLSKLPKDQVDLVKDAGWPLWWMPEPLTVQPGACGEIRIRMKRDPKPAELQIGIVTDQGVISTVVRRDSVQPRFASIGFSQDLRTAYLYSARVSPEAKPVRVFVDGRDMTASSTISADESLPVCAAEVRFDPPIQMMSYHTFRIEYSDGSAAQSGIRAWGHDMVYGVWSSPGRIADPEKALKSFVDDYAAHNVNCVMPFVVGAERQYFDSEAGWDYCESKGLGRMTMWPYKLRDETLLFAQDEPDATDANFQEVPPTERLGGCGQWLVEWSRALRDRAPRTPVLLNIDNTYKPENWYVYHQLPDVPCVDPYYTEQQDFADGETPHYFQYHTRPTYVRAVAEISHSSCQPKPLHVILLSCIYERPDGTRGRMPTPEEKRMEVYYAIGAGARGLSYWMFPSNCMGADTPESKALWTEAGLMGAEVRTAGPLITASCPAELPCKASPFLLVKTLLCGKDSVAVVTVNENVACDRLGTVVKPCEDAKISVTLPAWLEPKDAFLITHQGVQDLSWTKTGRAVELKPGTVRVSSFAVVTADASLRQRLQERYEKMFAENVKNLLAQSKEAEK